ncbi:MAG: tubulin-like doman-containing protein [Pseudonocardiales bacterium]
MKIYQPMLFVGLGGTGCKVGAELERRLREEICGPDGTRFAKKMTGANYLPYQLPSCLQFVYADLSSSELTRVRRRVVPGREHEVAAHRTMHLITDLVPSGLSNSAQIAQKLRLHLGENTIDWLPPKEGDPRIGPLVEGAGQLPTVGRAVLFETIRRAPSTAVRGLEEAIKEINESADALTALGGTLGEGVDVFVTFSVAGGTGSGIFYDYLHLVGDTLRQGGKIPRIYPLVMMPSAFEEGLGGGRPAVLNAGSALIDLFRLVDDQNTQGTNSEVNSRGGDGALTIRYPADQKITLGATTVRTAFLFGVPVGGVDRDDLSRSMVSFMLSLIGAGLTDPRDENDRSEHTHQLFADDFINHMISRHADAKTGVGKRGVSTSAVAAMTIPAEELTDIIASRLLAEAVRQLSVPPGGRLESNGELIGDFFVDCGLKRLQEREQPKLANFEIPTGYDAIMKVLNARAKNMEENLATLKQQLGKPMAKLAQEFDPFKAAELLLKRVDLFRLKRVAFGDATLPEKLDQGGFDKVLDNRRHEPPVPRRDFTPSPPSLQGVRKPKLSRLKWSDPTVKRVVQLQDEWYAWRNQQIWHAAWGENFRLWDRTWRRFKDELDALLLAFLQYAESESQRFTQRSDELYQSRVGVSYLLPPHGNRLEGFYQTVLDRFRAEFYDRLRANPEESDIVSVMLSDEGWKKPYLADRKSPENAVATVRQKIKEVVGQLFRPGDPEKQPLLPTMRDLLATTVGHKTDRVSTDDVYVQQFRQKLAGLVPGGYAPAGQGPLKILFSYPGDAKDAALKAFLAQEVALPKDQGTTPEFRAIDADAIAVVLFRTSMDITEVTEVRESIKLWSGSLRKPQPQDYLPWRQRLGHASDYLLMTPKDRVQILHRMLCAIWNDQLIVSGDERSPDSVAIKLGGREAVTMNLDLTGFRELSSWASLLHAYEEWILVDGELTRRGLAQGLMNTNPIGVDRDPAPPSALFWTIVAIEPEERKRIDQACQRTKGGSGRRLQMFQDFWSTTFPDALDMPFMGVTPADANTLRELVHSFELAERRLP